MYLHMYLFAGDIVSGIRRLELAFLSCCVHIWAEQTKIEWCGFCHGLSCLKDQKNKKKKYQVASRIPQGVLGFECGKILKRNKEIYKTSRLLGYSLLKSWPYDHHFKQNAANSCKFFKANWLRPLMLFTVKLAGWRMATSAPTWDVLYPTVFWRIRNTHCPHCRTKQEKTSNSNQTVALRSRWCQIRSVHGVNQNIGPVLQGLCEKLGDQLRDANNTTHWSTLAYLMEPCRPINSWTFFLLWHHHQFEELNIYMIFNDHDR
jgi:hypothetical protein